MECVRQSEAATALLEPARTARNVRKGKSGTWRRSHSKTWRNSVGGGPTGIDDGFPRVGRQVGTSRCDVRGCTDGPAVRPYHGKGSTDRICRMGRGLVMVPKIKTLSILSKPTRGDPSCLSLVLRAVQNLADFHGPATLDRAGDWLRFQ
jgi:hypothetical protein